MAVIGHNTRTLPFQRFLHQGTFLLPKYYGLFFLNVKRLELRYFDWSIPVTRSSKATFQILKG